MKSWRKRGSIRRRWLRSKGYGPDFSGFQRVAQNFIARPRTEVLWINPAAMEQLKRDRDSLFEKNP